MEEEVRANVQFSYRVVYLLLLLLPSSALLFAAGCGTPDHRPTAPADTSRPPTENHFVGNEACAGCHTREFQAHKHSNHAMTARLVADLGKIVLPRGAIFGSKCRMRPEGRNIRVTVGDSPDGAETLRYALGSGKTGITFVALTNHGGLFEMRASYFPHSRQWYRTPGHEDLAIDEMGLDYTADDARRCIGCHSTAMPSPTTTAPERRFLGVGCESCHGPGSVHIAAVSRNDLGHLGMDHLGDYSAEKLNALCGRCHRTGQDIMQLTPGLISETQRFQSLGIMKSRCSKESGDSLTCLTCHDPHTDATSNMRFYEMACLTCHGHASPAAPQAHKAVSAKPCPVSPQSGCIPCHMPARKILPKADHSPMAVDHFIHILPHQAHMSP